MPFSNNLLAGAAAATSGASVVSVDNSALFNDADAQTLTRVNGSAQTDTKKWTFSTWMNKLNTVNATGLGLLAGGSGTTSGRSDFKFTAGAATGDSGNYDAFKFEIYTGGWTQRRSLMKTRDVSGWYHVVLVYDAANATAADTLILYVNGVRQDWDSASGVPNNLSLINANGQTTRIGGEASGTPVEFNGYLAETVMLDGQAVAPTSFGEFDATGEYWTPLDTTAVAALTFGTNGFYLNNSIVNAPEMDASSSSSTAVAVSLTGEPAANTTNGTTNYTGLFDGVAIGTAVSDRIISLSVQGARSGAGARTVSSCTIGGVTAKLIKRSTTANSDLLEIWAAEVSSGTTADIDIITSATMDNLILKAWRVTGASFDSWLSIADTGTTLTANIALPLNSALITCAYNVGTDGVTWAGATEQYDENVEAGDDTSGAYNTSGPNVVTTVSASMATTHAGDSMAGVVWLPADGGLNNFTNNNTVTTSTHTPTNTHCLVNPLNRDHDGNWAYSNGNKTVNSTTSATSGNLCTLPIPHGAGFYWETIVGSTSGATGITHFASQGGEPNTGVIIQYNGDQIYDYDAGSQILGSIGATVVDDVIQHAYINGEYYIGREGTWFNSGLPDQGTGYVKNGFTNAFPQVVAEASGSDNKTTFVFEEADFTYALGAANDTDGFLALNTTNIAAATTRTVSDISAHFQTYLQTGTNVAHNIVLTDGAGDDVAAEFIWQKERGGTISHIIHDIIRGPLDHMFSNTTGAEASDSAGTGLTAFNSDGFSVGTAGSASNVNGVQTEVYWCAKLGGAASTNTAGDVNSSVSVNQTLGMSVGTFTTQASAGNYTVGTGLTGTAQLYFIKRLDGTGNWYGNHVGMPNRTGYYVKLDTTIAQTASTAIWGAGPSNGLIGLKSGAIHPESALSYMFIAFEVSEFMSIGSYEGNGNATNGTFIPTLNSLGVPIQPVWMMQKSIDSTSDWIIHDNAREGYNVDNDELAANTNSAEGTADQIDIVNGGIKNRIASDPNVAETYIYIAIGQPIISSDGLIKGAR